MATDPWLTMKESLLALRQHIRIFNDDQEIITSKHDLWSIKKLIVLRYYLKPFFEILRKNDFKKIHYVDLFAGSGLLKIKGKIMPGTSLVPLLTTKELLEKKPSFIFDYYHLSDNNKRYVDILKERIKKVSRGVSTQFSINQKDFGKAVEDIFPGYPPKFEDMKENAYLVVLDPYGFQIDWEHLTLILRSGAVDVLITFPTRLVSWNQNKEQSAPSLTKMFGNNDWVTCETEEDFLKEYCKRIQNVPVEWLPFKTKTFTVQTSNGKYHLIFASRSPGADSVFSDMQKKFDAVDNDLLEAVFDASVGGQPRIEDYF